MTAVVQARVYIAVGSRDITATSFYTESSMHTTVLWNGDRSHSISATKAWGRFIGQQTCLSFEWFSRPGGCMSGQMENRCFHVSRGPVQSKKKEV